MRKSKTAQGPIWKFRLSNIGDLEELAHQLNVSIDAIEDVSILSEPVRIGKLVIPNSLAIHPMEGCDGDSQGRRSRPGSSPASPGRPGKLTFRRYERFAAGRAGLIWAEAIAIVPEARANPRQLWLNKQNKDAFAALIKRIRQCASESNGPDHRPVIVAQLTHSGRYSKPDGTARPIIPQRDPYRDIMIPQQRPDPPVVLLRKSEEAGAKSKIPDDWPIVTDGYFDKLQDAYIEAARIAFEVGFDAVDIKSCHGYLINELLACRNRPGKYGGSFENRTRFLLEVIDRIHKELGYDVPVVTRLGVYDAIPYPYGWGVDQNDYTKADLTEPKRLISLLRQRGVRLINVTAANPYYNPHIGRPFNEPIVGGYEEPEHPFVGVVRLINLAGEIQKEFPDIAIVGTGYSWLRTLFANVAAASKVNGLATLIGAGRMAFAYPDFAKDIITYGRMYPEKVCISCSACTQIMRDGGMTGCVVRDNEVYGPIFELGRMSDRDNLLRLASACRLCQEPMCQLGCPAGVDIPKFINLFIEGDDRGAYEVLREKNIFPEVCAWLCPVENQCEGSCLRKFIGDPGEAGFDPGRLRRPVPIAHIQKYLAERANRSGWSRLRVPKKTSGKKVAIIGAGPAGLACAAKLLEAGHIVTIFDKNNDFGGIINSIIPAFRYGGSLHNEIAAIFEGVPEDRMILRLGVELDSDFNLNNIFSSSEAGDGSPKRSLGMEFDAVFIGMGLPNSVGIGDKEKDIDGLWNAMDFLSTAKEPGKLDIKRKRVAVIGGGNTAMDVAITAKSLDAEDVYVIYRRSFAEMPAWSAERDRAINEGVHFLILTQPLRYNRANGKLTSVTFCPTRLGEPDASGRRGPETVESSAYDLDMDIVVEAIGQKTPHDIRKILPSVELKDGLIETKEGSSVTSRSGVFAGGDIVRGPSTVVAAVAGGMKAAEEIDKFLKETRTSLKTPG